VTLLFVRVAHTAHPVKGEGLFAQWKFSNNGCACCSRSNLQFNCAPSFSTQDFSVWQCLNRWRAGSVYDSKMFQWFQAEIRSPCPPLLAHVCVELGVLKVMGFCCVYTLLFLYNFIGQQFSDCIGKECLKSQR
jgi:hypothetical protein